MIHPRMTSSSWKFPWVRITLDILFLLAVIVAPWWVAVILGLVLLVGVRAYEAALGGVVMDVLYVSPASSLFGGDFVFTAGFMLVATVMWFIEHPTTYDHIR
jgi:hypothetical protein